MGALMLACLLAVPPATPPTQDDWGPGEAWAVARATTSRPVRVRALVAAMAEVAGDPAALHPRLLAAFDAFRGEHDDYHDERALALARAMHEHARATWSAYCLEGILRRRGEYARAEQVLATHLPTVRDPGERLDGLQRQAILCAGAGWRERERDLLGAALAQGGTDAQQMLGRLALAEGDRATARALFRGLVERHAGPDADADQAPPWALRGWGLALLPPAVEPLRREPGPGGR